MCAELPPTMRGFSVAVLVFLIRRVLLHGSFCSRRHAAACRRSRVCRSRCGRGAPSARPPTAQARRARGSAARGGRSQRRVLASCPLLDELVKRPTFAPCAGMAERPRADPLFALFALVARRLRSVLAFPFCSFLALRHTDSRTLPLISPQLTDRKLSLVRSAFEPAQRSRGERRTVLLRAAQ